MFHEKNPTYIQVLYRFRNVELVHGRYDDRRSGEKKEQEEEQTVDGQAADPPGKAPYWQVLPADEMTKLLPNLRLLLLHLSKMPSRGSYQWMFCGSGA